MQGKAVKASGEDALRRRGVEAKRRRLQSLSYDELVVKLISTRCQCLTTSSSFIGIRNHVGSTVIKLEKSVYDGIL